MSSMNELQRQYFAALDEYTGSCTVIIRSVNPRVHHGSGVAVKYGGNEYILTASHVLRNEPDNTNLRIIGKPDSPLQMLRGKNELAVAISRRDAPQTFSSATSITVTGRLIAEADDIAAIKVERLTAALPHTMLHDLSQQGQTAVTPGTPVTIFGYPGELATPYKQRSTGRRGLSAFPHITVQEVVDLKRAPGTIDPRTYFVTDFDYPEDQCDPHGMSGCGAWNFPQPQSGGIWSPASTQLLGIEIGHYESRNVLQFVRVERVIRLLSDGE